MDEYAAYPVKISAVPRFGDGIYSPLPVTLFINTRDYGDRVDSVEFKFLFPKHYYIVPTFQSRRIGWETHKTHAFYMYLSCHGPSILGCFRFLGRVLNCFQNINAIIYGDDEENWILDRTMRDMVVIRLSNPTKRIDPRRFQGSWLQLEESGIRIKSKFAHWKSNLLSHYSGPTLSHYRMKAPDTNPEMDQSSHGWIGASCSDSMDRKLRNNPGTNQSPRLLTSSLSQNETQSDPETIQSAQSSTSPSQSRSSHFPHPVLLFSAAAAGVCL